MKKLKFILGILISIFFLSLVFKKIDFSHVLEIILHVNIVDLIFACFALILFFLSFALKWKFIYSDFKIKPKYNNILKGVIIGYMGNNIFPARIGEFMRIFFMKKKENIHNATTFATLILERLFDGAAIVTFFVCILFFDTHIKQNLDILNIITYDKLKFFGYIAGFLFIGFILVLFLFRNRIKFFAKMSHKFPFKYFKKAKKMFFAFARGLHVLEYWKEVLKVYFASVITWSLGALVIYFCLAACNINLPVSASFFTVTFMALGCMIPSSPGFVGTLEFFLVFALACYGIDKETALAFALLYHSIEMIPVTIIGFILYFKENMDFRGEK